MNKTTTAIIAGQNTPTKQNTIAERSISALLAKYKDIPANKGLLITDKYMPPKSFGPTSLC